MSTNRRIVIDHSDLYHYGIEGMHWGIRRFQPYPKGYSGDGKFVDKAERKAQKRLAKQNRKTEKMAYKDAKRYADAKMYYGEGAGIRRRHLKAELDKKKKDPVYSKAFDKAVENVSYARSAQKAKVERRTRDTAVKTKKVVRKAGPIAAAAGSIYYATHKQQVDSFVVSKMDKAFRAVKNASQRRQASQFLRRMGL